jgi:hypothetical protein
MEVLLDAIDRVCIVLPSWWSHWCVVLSNHSWGSTRSTHWIFIGSLRVSIVILIPFHHRFIMSYIVEQSHEYLITKNVTIIVPCRHWCTRLWSHWCLFTGVNRQVVRYWISLSRWPVAISIRALRVPSLNDTVPLIFLNLLQLLYLCHFLIQLSPLKIFLLLLKFISPFQGTFGPHLIKYFCI